MYLKNSKIIVIKIGSSLLVDDKKKIRKKWLLSFAKDIKNLKSRNKKIIIVSSGAIAPELTITTFLLFDLNFLISFAKLDNHLLLIFLFLSIIRDDPIFMTIIFEFLRCI